MNFKDKLALAAELSSQLDKRRDEVTELRLKADSLVKELHGPCGFYYSIKHNSVRIGDDYKGISYSDDTMQELHAFLSDYLRYKGVINDTNI